MSTLDLRIKYRPIRIGWCVRDNNWEDLRRAIRLTHAFWGGRYNPIIPVGNLVAAKELIESYFVDVLYPPEEEPSFADLKKLFSYLPWPHHMDLFVDDGKGGKSATFLNIFHPVRLLYEEHVKNLLSPSISAVQFLCDMNDPIGDILLATFGAYPSPEETSKDYSEIVHSRLNGKRITLSLTDHVEPEAFKFLTPSVITTYNLVTYNYSRREYPGISGIYWGNVSNFSDIVNFWNLRARNEEVYFYDPAYSDRLRPLVDSYLATLRQRPPDQSGFRYPIVLWKSEQGMEVNPSEFGSDVAGHIYSPNKQNHPMHFEEQSVIAAVDEEGARPSVTFQLPQKPFFDEVQLYGQHVVVSVKPLVDIRSEEWTFQLPFIPELNEYYGREYLFIGWNETRAEIDGLGIVEGITTDHLTLHALPAQQLISKIFEVFGMNAEASQAGLIGTRLIQQMGGLQKCRVFKIAGVRKLIEDYSPFQSFTKSAALMTIGQYDNATKKLNFEAYESLFLQPRKSEKLKPEDAFVYLLERGVFRAGLKFNCPACRLDFWLTLDDVATEVDCEYCGKAFNVMPQLRDRDWAYRRSGLFGRDDHQEGGIPVALTLQQLDTSLHRRPIIYTTGLTISPKTAAINECETDFAVLSEDYSGKVELAIGECKSNLEISEGDIENLMKIADALPSKRINVYIVFSKTSDFSSVEIDRFRAARKRYAHSIILLSKRELEPYHIYEYAEKDFEIRRHVGSFEELTQATRDIYFEPKAKKKA